MNAYALLKLGHVTCVAISGALFVYRYLLLNLRPERPLPKPLRFLPHINDSVLLGCAVAMLVLVQLNPLTVPWLLAKIIALLLYIGLGVVCMRSLPASRQQTLSFIASLAVFGYILLVATTKQVLPI